MTFNPIGPEFRVNTSTAGNQRIDEFSLGQSIAMDSEGDFVVTWTSDGRAYAQRYNAVGEKQGGEFQVSTSTGRDQRYSTVAMDSEGDFVVTWSGFSRYSKIFAQRYNAAGERQGEEFEVSPTRTVAYQQYSSVAMDADGDFVVTWSVDTAIKAQRYNAAGEKQGGEFQVNTTTQGSQLYSTVAMDADGDFVVSWSAYGQGQVYAQRYNATGVAQGGEFQVTPTTTYRTYSTVGMDADGDFVISWTSDGRDGDGSGVYAQRYNAAGEKQGGEFQVNTTTQGSQRESTVSMDADGDFVISWTSFGQSSGVYAQRYNAAGEKQGGEFQVNTTTQGSRREPTVSMDADGDFGVAWNSYGQDGSGYGVYAQRYEVTPAFSVIDSTVTEGNSGTTNATFTVTLDEDSTQQLTVNYATENDTATAPADYASTTGTLAFAPGQTTQTITVPVVGDTIDEADETFKLNLSNPSPNTAIADAKAIGTITDNDDAIGTALQSGSEGELIDLRPQAGKTVEVTVSITRDAGFNNVVGFYTVQGESGAVFDPLSGMELKPGDAGFAGAAVRLSQENGFSLGVEDTTLNFDLQGGSIYAPYLIANSTVNQVLNEDVSDDPNVFFNYTGANPSKFDHVKLLGQNQFSFEDLVGGGDQDFNDAVLKLDLQLV